VLVTDAFMEAVRDGDEWICAAPRTDRARQGSTARSALPEAGRDPSGHGRALHHLHRQGERDHAAPPRELGLKVSTSNLCSKSRFRPDATISATIVPPSAACPSSTSRRGTEWNKDKVFIEDVMRFLDNVLTDYIDRAPENGASQV
jgi:ribonucleoside-diphosphate reductase alpha chain